MRVSIRNVYKKTKLQTSGLIQKYNVFITPAHVYDNKSTQNKYYIKPRQNMVVHVSVSQHF